MTTFLFLNFLQRRSHGIHIEMIKVQFISWLSCLSYMVMLSKMAMHLATQAAKVWCMTWFGNLRHFSGFLMWVKSQIVRPNVHPAKKYSLNMLEMVVFLLRQWLSFSPGQLLSSRKHSPLHGRESV